MNIRHYLPFFSFYLFLTLVGLACANSTPAPAPPEPTSIPAAANTPSLAATEPPTATSIPPTATATEIPPTPTPALRVFDFRQMNDIILTMDMASPDTLYARTRFGGTTSYQSTDAGNTWKIVTPDPEYAQIQQSLQGGKYWRDPQTPTILYGVSEVMLFMKSVDGGQSWAPLTVPFNLMDLLVGLGILEIHPLNSNILFVTTMSAMYKSSDGGETWLEVNGLPEPGPSGLNFQQFIFDPSLSNTVYAMDIGGWGAFKSTDGGDNWRCLCESQGQASFYIKWLAIDPLDSNILYAQNNIDGQLYTSPDGGQTWQPTTLGLSSSDVYAFIISRLNPSTRYAILGTGEISGLFKSTDNGQTWIEIQTVLLP